MRSVPALQGTGTHVWEASHFLSIHYHEVLSTYVLSESMETYHIIAEWDALSMTPGHDFQTSVLHVHVVDGEQEGQVVDRSSMGVCTWRHQRSREAGPTT